MISNNGRAFETFTGYWHVEDFTNFENILIHSQQENINYLTCLGCSSIILGFQLEKVFDKEGSFKKLYCMRTSKISI